MIRSQLSGANGEHTGLDDIDAIDFWRSVLLIIKSMPTVRQDAPISLHVLTVLPTFRAGGGVKPRITKAVRYHGAGGNCKQHGPPQPAAPASTKTLLALLDDLYAARDMGQNVAQDIMRVEALLSKRKYVVRDGPPKFPHPPIPVPLPPKPGDPTLRVIPTSLPPPLPTIPLWQKRAKQSSPAPLPSPAPSPTSGPPFALANLGSIPTSKAVSAAPPQANAQTAPVPPIPTVGGLAQQAPPTLPPLPQNAPEDQPFMFSKPPNCRTLHSFDYDSASTRSFIFDCLGAPYCGLVCIDVSIGRKPDVNRYLAIQETDDPLDCGTAQFLYKYSASVGTNLCIEYSLPGIDRIRFQHSLEWKTTFLHYRPLDDTNPNLGHYFLICEFSSSMVDSRFRTITFDNEVVHPDTLCCCFPLLVDVARWFFHVEKEYVPVAYFSAPSDRDMRSVVNKRDQMESQDISVEVVRRRHLCLFGRSCFHPYDRRYLVSVKRFESAYSELQSLHANGMDPTKSLLTVSLIRTINTDAMDPLVVETCRLLRDIAGDMAVSSSVSHDHATIAYNSNAYDAIFTERTAAMAAASQANAIVGAGNYVVRHRAACPKVNVPVAACGLPVFDWKGQVGPGFISVTDSLTLLLAFSSRSMCPPPMDLPSLESFVIFSRSLCRRLAKQVELSVPSEMSPVDAFRSFNAGKKTVTYIERVVADYNKYVLVPSDAQFARHGAFVKFESNYKKEGLESGGKPRLIMTMSDLMKVECAPAMSLIHAWNHGPFSRYQVKDISPDDMIRRVMEVSRSSHNVTDYSSFEASVNWLVRTIELDVLLTLCDRFQYYDTARAIRKHSFGATNLHTRWGVFHIQSRKSGDYWTSFGNGIVNFCLLAYSNFIRTRSYPTISFEAIVEGDDGLVPSHIPLPDLIARVGFKYSVELHGTQPGDCDFLRSLWVDGKRFLNVPRCFRMLWLKKAASLKRSKQLWLLRCMARSLHHLSPGHPVLSALVTRIMRETRHVSPFKNFDNYLDTWKSASYLKHCPYDVPTDEGMRAQVACGAPGFPSIPISVQLELERRILIDPHIYVGHAFDDSPDFVELSESNKLLRVESTQPGAGIRRCLAVFGLPLPV